ncbi:MAG: lysylphosphatidylglycerol synthase domain-containing protein [Candidatus Kerfeldbacteria bacterium]
MMRTSSKILQKIGQILIYVVIFIFIGKILSNNWSDISVSLKSANYLLLLSGIFLIVLILYLQSYIWHLLLKQSNNTLKFSASFITYFKSVITRYLPGGIWVYFARTYLTGKLGFKKTQIIFLILIESLFVVATGSISILLFQPPSDIYIIIAILSIILTITGFVFIFSPSFFIKIYKTFYNKILSIIPLNRQTIAKATSLYFILWILSGLFLYIIINAFTPLGVDNIPSLIGIYAISWVVGFVVFFMPSGIGVRDVFLIILLSTIVSVPIATLVALIARIVFLIGEIICFFISLIIEKKHPLPN